MNCMHSLTLNVQGLRDKQKQERFYTYIKQQKANVIFIQETHFTQELENTLNQKHKWQYFHCYDSNQSRGVSILIDKNISAEVVDIKKEADGRALLFNIKVKKPTTA